MLEPLFNRIQEVIKYSKLNDRKFCERIGFGYSTYKNYTLGYRNPSNIELYAKTLYTYVEISAEWLIRGEGEMIRADNQNQLSASETIKMINEMRKELIGLAIENGKLKEQIDELKRKKGIMATLASPSFSSIAADATEPYKATEDKNIDKNR